MANAKKSEELDAVTAAYESISAKLDDLRKKQAELSEESSDDSRQPSVKKHDPAEDSNDDPDKIEEFDSEEEESDDPKSSKNSDPEPLDPLPGTEDEDSEEEPNKQVYKANDPLDDESEEESAVNSQQSSEEDDFEHDDNTPKLSKDSLEEEEDLPSLRERGAKLNPNADEMEKWEKLKDESVDSEEEQEAQPTYQPLSQQEFQSRLRRPQSEEEQSAVSHQSSARQQDDLVEDRGLKMEDSEVDSLDDLAEETIEPSSAFPQRNRPAPVEGLEDDWGIRHLKPHHNESTYDSQESHYNEIPQRELRQAPRHEDENYFDRRNEPLPRKRASIWHLIILVLIGLGVIGATVYFLKYQFNEPAKPSPSPEISSPSPVPTPTPEPPKEVSDRSQFTVRVLNGTSKAGWAGDVLKKLKDAGFKTDRSGNATNSAFTQTVIRVKDSSESAALINTITKDLGSEFSPTSDTSLKSSDKADAEVILGQK